MSIKTLLGGTVLTAVLALSALPVTAATPHERFVRQHARIHQGVESGSLTRREARRLNRQERRLQRVARRDRMTGGGMSWRERRRLERRLNGESGRIYRLKHNRRSQ